MFWRYPIIQMYIQSLKREPPEMSERLGRAQHEKSSYVSGCCHSFLARQNVEPGPRCILEIVRGAIVVSAPELVRTCSVMEGQAGGAEVADTGSSQRHGTVVGAENGSRLLMHWILALAPQVLAVPTFVLGPGCRGHKLWNSATRGALLTSTSRPALLPCNLILCSAPFQRSIAMVGKDGRPHTYIHW